MKNKFVLKLTVVVLCLCFTVTSTCIAELIIDDYDNQYEEELQAWLSIPPDQRFAAYIDLYDSWPGLSEYLNNEPLLATGPSFVSFAMDNHASYVYEDPVSEVTYCIAIEAAAFNTF